MLLACDTLFKSTDGDGDEATDVIDMGFGTCTGQTGDVGPELVTDGVLFQPVLRFSAAHDPHEEKYAPAF